MVVGPRTARMAHLLPLDVQVVPEVVVPERAMDVGFTKSNKDHPLHFVVGLIVVTIGYSAIMFAVRVAIMG